MVRRDGRRRRVLRWLPEILVLLMLAVAVVQVRFDVAGQLGWEPADPATDPAHVQAPVGLELPAQGAAPGVARAAVDATPDPARVRAALHRFVDDRRLGRHVSVVVAGSSGPLVYRHGIGTVTPASTMKLLTSTAALESLGPTTRFETSVRQVPGSSRIVLVGGGDPFLASTPRSARGLYPPRADLLTLARETATGLKAQAVRRVRLAYDSSLFSGPAVDRTWPDDYISDDVVPPISALWVDEGHEPKGYGYVADPAREAARLFAAQLRHLGITVVGKPAQGHAGSAARAVASVRSAPLAQIVERTLGFSDNNAAEVIARHVGLAERGSGSFSASAAAVLEVLRRLGIPTSADRVYDGSGLSRKDRLDPDTIIEVLRTAADPAHPELRAVITGLPVAGFTGSLKYRFDESAPAGRGRVRAKTGTLTGVHGLAGIASDRSGAEMYFVMLADRVAVPNTLAARALLDKMAAALGACRCAATSPGP